MFVKGFAPFGTGPANKLTKDEYNTMARNLVQKLPTHLQSLVKICSPFIRNHQIQFIIVPGGYDNCRRVQEHMAGVIERDNIKIRNKEVRCTVEMSPRRKTQYNNLFRAIDKLKIQVDEAAFEVCSKTAQIYTADGLLVVGSTPKDSDAWLWNPAGLSALGAEMLDDTQQD